MLSLSFSIPALAIRQSQSQGVSAPEVDGFTALYDASDLTTLFQDVAMASNVAANGAPIGAILDKSGNGHHLVQASAAARPLYKTDGALHWIEGDGVDDILTGTIPTSGYPFTLAVAFEPIGSTGAGIAGLYQGESDYKALMVNTYLRAVDRTATTTWQAGNTSSGAPPKSVAIASFDGTSSELMTQNYTTVSSNYTQTFGAPSNFRLLSFRNSDHWNGRIYAAVAFNRLLAANEKTTLMHWLAARAGIAL